MSFFKRIFGIKDDPIPTPKTNQNAESSQKKTQQEDLSWICESILQFVSSSAFECELDDFKDENCLIFNEEEESTHQQFLIFKKFTLLIEKKLVDLVKILGISEKNFCKAALLCHRDPRYRKIMEEVIFADDFEFFKKMMSKKNKKLEEMACKNEKKISKIQALEQEQKDFEYALELSKKMYENCLKEIESEENTLQQALLLSKIAYEEEMAKLRNKNEELKKKPNLNKIEDLTVLETNEDKICEKDTLNLLNCQKIENEKLKAEIEMRLKKEKEELTKKLIELTKMKKSETANEIEESLPLKLMSKQNNEPKNVEESETLEERKERMSKQRELLIQQRKEERKVKLGSKTEKVNQLEMKKETLDLTKIKHKQIYDELLKENVL